MLQPALQRVGRRLGVAPPWTYLSFAVALAAFTTLCKALNLGPSVWTTGTQFYLVPVAGISCVVAGLIVRDRYQATRMGLLLILNGYAFLAEDLQLAPWAWVHTLGLPLSGGSAVALMVLFLAYPGGTLTSRLDRAVIGWSVFFAVVWVPLAPLLWQPGQNPPSLLTIGSLSPGLNGAYLMVSYIASGAGTVYVIARVVLRLRAASPVRRSVMRPFAYAAAGWVGGSLIWAFVKLTAYQVPWAEIDTESAVEVILALVVLAVPWAFLAGISQLGAAQARALQALSTLGPAPAPAEITDALRTSLGDRTLTLALGTEDAAALAAFPSKTITRLSPQAALVHDPALLEDPALLPAIGPAIADRLDAWRLANAAEELNRELTEARQRLVAAADEARRRVERDVHDGPQQRLLTLGLMLESARGRLLSGDGRDTAATLARAEEVLALAVEELRLLSQGSNPPVLRDFGLVAALHELAEECPLPTTLDVADLDDLPDHLQSALYFVAAEATTNAIRHSRAGRLRIVAARTATEVGLEVHDDGIGGAALNGGGSGLAGLADRLGALGGRLAVLSEPGQGTSVSAVLPVDADPTAAA